MTRLGVGAVVLGLAAGLGCGGDSGGRDAGLTSGGGVTTLGTSGDGDETSGDGDGDGSTSTGPLLDMPAGDGDGDDPPDECAAVSETAQNEYLPVDIVFAVDTSGSMVEEKNFVQQNMNLFSQQIFLANIDYHVVMIAEAAPEGPCVNVPLGSGQCPEDSKLPGYLHVFETVGSSDALTKIISTQPQWSTSIRPGSIKHLVVVSDDDSAIGAAEFDSMFKAIDPDYADYYFHAIVAYENPNPLECSFLGATCCAGLIPLSADIGQVYLDLAQLTGGVTGDLCEQQFGPVFNQIAQSVLGTTPLACEWDIPDPPEGESFDPGKVNVELQLDGVDESVFFVASEAECGAGDGWYYQPDNQSPETIRVCPATCTRIQAATEASVDILFGCETVPVG